MNLQRRKYNILEIISCDSSKYTINHPDLTVSNFAPLLTLWEIPLVHNGLTEVQLYISDLLLVQNKDNLALSNCSIAFTFLREICKIMVMYFQIPLVYILEFLCHTITCIADPLL